MPSGGNLLAALEREAQERLMTRKEFSAALASTVKDPSLGLAGLQFVLAGKGENQELTLGLEGEGNVSFQTEEMLTNMPPHEWSAVMKIWRAKWCEERGTLESLGKQAWGCLEAWWGADSRDALTGTLDMKNRPDVKPRAEGALLDCRHRNLPAAVLAFDLDGFKRINDEHPDHSEGDAALQLFARTIDEAANGDAVIMRNGGDEFMALIPNADELRAIEFAIALIERCQNAFEAAGYPIGVSAGIASSVADDEREFEELCNEADRAETSTKKTAKGSVRFAATAQSPQGEEEEVPLIGATALVKSAISSDEPAPFANVWLNALARRVAREAGERGIVDLRRLSEDFLKEAKLDVGGNALPAAGQADRQPRTEAAASPAALALAIACGLFHAGARDIAARQGVEELNLLVQDGAARLVDGAGAEPWGHGEIAVDEKLTEIPLGRWWTLADSEQLDPKAARLCLLVQIGDMSDEQIPSWPLADRIHVDPRPHSGGGLPDFWQLTLARVIDALDRAPNVSRVAVAGAVEHGMHSLRKLEGAAEWKVHELQEKLTLPYEQIERAQQRLDGAVKVVDSLDDLLELIAPDARAERGLIGSSGSGRTQQRHLPPAVPLDDYKLNSWDGCRAETIREAFPVVLAALRDAAERPENLIRDENGESLVEFIDYKIEISTPEREQVPDYFEDQDDDLEGHFEGNFLASEGKFSPYMTAPEVLDPLIEHLHNTVKAKPPFVTRRAILVVEHEIQPNEPLSPLGLVSMRCAPRPREDHIELRHSFLWRTVEALVGLPYSLYGSVRLAQHVAQVLAEHQGEDQPPVRLGPVSYVASSLHMYVDELGQNIARHIVNDARR